MYRLRWLVVVAMCWTGSSAWAQDDGGVEPSQTGTAAAERDWRFELVPYGWLAGVDGEVSARGVTADVSVGLEDILDKTDMVLSFISSLQYKRFVLWNQFDYLALSTDEVTRGSVSGRLENEGVLWTVGLGYDLPTFDKNTIGIMAGLRYTYMNNTVEIGGSDAATDDFGIADAVLILRPSLLIGWGFAFRPILSIGGGSSNLTYELQPQIEFKWEILSARLGYRNLYFDYEGERGGRWKGSVHGLLLGVGVSI